MSFDPGSAVADEPAGFDPSTAEFDAESATPEPRRGGTRTEAKPYVPADDGMRPGEAGAGRGRVNPPLALEQPAPAAMPQGPGAALATIRENQQARDQRLNAPQPAPGSRSVFDGAPVQVPEQTGGFTPQEMEEGSVAPWKREEQRRMGEYMAPTNPAVMTEGEAGLSQRAGQSVMDATANPRLAAAARGATDAALIAPEAMATGAKLAADIANLGTLGAAQPVSDWLGMTIKAVQDSKSPRYQELRGEFGRLLQDPNAGVLDVVAFMASNPAFTVEVGAPSVPSMLLGAQGARIGMALAGKGAAETGATLGATAANVGMNAGSTFSDTQGDLGQKLAAAGAAGAGTALLGRMGGAETALATGRAAGLGGIANVALREGAQEAGESLSQSLGQGTAEGNFDLGTAAKQAASEGVIGGVLGGAAGAMAGEKPIRPTERRRAIDDRLDDFAATHGVLPKAIAALKEQAARRPLSDVAGFYKRGIAALARRGLVGGQVDDGALSQLDEPPPPVKEIAQEVSREALPPEVPPAPLDVETAAPEPVAPEQALEDNLANRLGIAEPEAAPAPPPPTSTQDLAGRPINRNWTAFTPESGTLNLPREQLPQIKAEHRGALVNFLGARGITHETDAEVDPASLKPTQGEFSPAKVQQAREFVGGDRSILVSADGYVLDGHHQWLAKLDGGQPVKAIRLNAPIQDLLRLAHQFPSSTTARGATRAAPINAGASPQPVTPGDAVAEGGGPAMAPAPSTFQVLTRAGRTPNATEPIELRPNEDGTLTPFMGGKAMLDFNSGDPIMIPAGASDLDAKKAIRDAGAVSNRTNFYPATKGAAPASEPAAPPPAPPAAPPAVAAAPAPAPKPKRTAPVRGSNALGQISARLGGISPDLLADLSDKAQRTRTSKTGAKTQYAAWDNPLHQGHGPLFRKGGSADLSEIARVLEEEGYLAPGSVERDPIAASQRAQEIIRAELKQGGSTLREGDPAAVEAEMERRREAAQYVPDDLLAPLTDSELEESGYAGASTEVKEAVERLMVDAEAAGIDTEALREDAARATEGLTEDEYHARLQAAIREALDAGRQDRGGAAQVDPEAAQRGGEDRGQADGGEGQEERPALELTAPTRAKVLEQQAALEREQEDREAPADQPKDKRTADTPDMFNTQGSVFDQPAEPEQAAAPSAAAEKPKADRAEQRERLEQIADRLGVKVFKAAGGWHATRDAVDIPDGDVDVVATGAVSANHVFAHELGHVVMQKRGLGFKNFPRAEVERYIPNWDEFIAASKEFRPGVHDHENERFRKHAKKPDEIIADAIASVLIGAQPVSMLKPMMDKLGITERDLGLADKTAKPAAAPQPQPEKAEKQAQEKIDDFGEKIGGARKDTAESGFTKTRRAADDEDRPAWARRFKIAQIVKAGGQIGSIKDEGRWVIRDSRSTDWTGQSRQVGRDTFATKEEAEAYVPIAAVSLKHKLSSTRDGKYEIWREVSDRKRVKVVDQQFDTREEAMAYMVKNAVQIIETNTTFGEADIPLPPDRARTGPQRRTGDVKGDDFAKTFGFRGVEFGNWNNQVERQALMNDAFDGMMDLAEVLGVPPKALGLNGDLALAFGARGNGLNSARAHYEMERAVINLTKERGAGSLAHEWFHALDHYFGRQDGKASAEWVVQKDGTRMLKVGEPEATMASGGFQRNNSGVRPELRAAYEKLLKTMFKKAEAYVEDTAKADKFTAATREELAQQLDALRKELSAQKDPKYYKRNNKPASAELLAEFDTIAKALLEADASAIAIELRTIGDLNQPASVRARIANRWTNDSLERLSAIYKEVRGRSGFDSTNQNGVMDRLRGYMTRYSQRLKMLADAQSGTEKTRMVPTDFAMNAKELDQGRGTDYWTTPHEMAARAFQGYVEDKIAEQGGMSRFLNYGPENVGIPTPWGFKRPFPAGAERVAINKAFDAFVGEIQTRETDTGVLMFSAVDGDAPAPDTARYAADPDPRHLRIVDFVRESVAERRPGFLLRAVEAPGSRSDLRAARAVARGIAGHKVIFVKQDNGRAFNGAAFGSPGTDYLLIDVDSSRPVMAVTGHEMLHRLRGARPDLYAKLDKRISAVLQSESEYAKALRARYEKLNLKPLSDDKIHEELIADIFGDEWNDPDFWRELAKDRPSGFRAIVDAVLKFLDDMIAKVVKQRPFGTEFYLTDMRAARDAVLEATREFSAGEVGPIDTVPTDLSFSAAAPRPEPPAETTPRAIQRKVQDQFNRFTVIRDWAVEQGLNMTPDSNVWAYEERMHGRIATRVEDFREKTVKPKIKAIQKAGFTMAQVAEYLHAQHAEERNKQIESIDPTNPAGSGMTTADAKAILAAADPKLAALANDFRKITEDTKAILLKAGIVSKDMTDAWEAAYQNYVPLKGGDEAAQQGTGKGLAANGRQKRALGHGERSEFVVENILRDHERAITVAEKNIVGHSLLTFIADLGREDIATIGQPEKRKVLKNSTDYEVLDGNGARIAIFDSQAGAAAFISKHSQPGLFASIKGPLTANPVRGDPSVAFMATPMLADNEVNVYVKGHAIRVQLNDPLLAQAYTRSGQEGLNQLMAINREINAYLSKVYTGYNPEFLLTNIARDLTTGVINITGKFGAGMAAKALGNYPKAFASLWRYAMTGKETPDIKAYRDAGGSTGASYLSDIERIGKDVQEAYDEYKGAVATYRDRGALPAARAATNRWLGRFLLAPIRHINEAGENAMRLAVFQAVRDTKGNTVNDAASAAKNVTVNFNRRGEWGQVLGSMYLFFNPAIQGTAAIADSLVNGKNKGQAIALTGSLGVLAYMLAAGQFGGGDDDDEAWAAIPDYVKDKNLIIRTGEKTYITIPIPYGYGFFYALGNATYDLQKGARDIDKIALKIASNLLEHFSPIGNPMGGDKPEARGLVELIPGAVGGELQRDLVRLMANRNGMGSDIVPDSPFDEGKPDSMKVFRSTKGTIYDKAARAANELTGGTESQAGGISVSPETLKYWTHTVTGGAGAFISDSVGLAGLGARYLYNGADPDKGDLRPEFKEIPIFRRFAKEEGVQDRRRVFWTAAGEVREAQADLTRAKKIHDDAGEGKVWAQRGELVAMGAYMASVSKMVKAQRDLVDEVMADKTTSLAYKRARVRALEKEEQMLYDEFTREFNAEKARAKAERAATP